MSETEKKCWWNIKDYWKILDYNKNAQKFFLIASKVDKGKSVPKKIIVERNIEESVKLRRRRIAEIEEEQENINNELLNRYFTNYRSSSDMYKRLCKTEGERNDQVSVIKKVLNKMKKNIKKEPEDRKLMIDENEKIIDIVERIFYLNQVDQSGQGLKITTPNQILSRLPISLAQLKAVNNSEKLKNEIRQILYSLYR